MYPASNMCLNSVVSASNTELLIRSSKRNICTTSQKGAYSSAVAFRLATTFASETVQAASPQELEFTTGPIATCNSAEVVQVAPVFDMTEPHQEIKAIYLPTVYVAERGTTDSVTRYSPVRVAPAGQKAAWSSPRQKAGTRTVRAKDVHPAREESVQTVL